MPRSSHVEYDTLDDWLGSESFTPLPWSIVVAGSKQKHRHLVEELLDDRRWHRWNVVDKLPKDPFAGGIGHKENGTWVNTQLLVIEQERFPEVVEDILRWGVNAIIDSEGGGTIVECNRGEHRSDVVSRWCESSGNRIRATNGQRLFNVQVFALNEVYGYNGVWRKIDEAKRWLENPWCLMEVGSSRYAAETCHNSHRAYRNMELLQEFESHVLPGIARSSITLKYGEFSPLLVPESSDSEEEQDYHPQSASQEALKDDEFYTLVEFRDDDNVTIAGIDYRRVRPRPSYATDEFTVDAWWELLDEHGIDKTARYTLYMLAQTSPEGKARAVDLLAKLQNKGRQNQFESASRWLHQAASRARASLADSSWSSWWTR